MVFSEEVVEAEREAISGANELEQVSHATEVKIYALVANAAGVDPLTGKGDGGKGNDGNGTLKEAVVVGGNVAQHGHAVQPVFQMILVG